MTAIVYARAVTTLVNVVGSLTIASTAIAAEITGAGASFPNPIYSKWADAYQKATGNRVNYQSIGSSGGIRQIRAKTEDIGVVRRADGSGTTAIFTNYLSKVSPEWKEKIGEGTTAQWPVGLGGKGNEGVSAFVQRLPGSIGYIESAYAKQNKLAHAQL